MGKVDYNLDIASGARPEPLTFSIKRAGDPAERFISRELKTLYFSDDSGIDMLYTLEITDANGIKSTSTFNLTCERPANCQEGPLIEDIVTFNASELTYRFHGVRVDRIKRKVLSGNFITDLAVDVPSSNIVTTRFSPVLGAGTYTLQLEGDSCYSPTPSARQFIITDDNSPLAWSPGFPSFTYGANNCSLINISVNKAGKYPLKIINSNNFAQLDTEISLSPGELQWLACYSPDTYTVQLGPLTGTVVVGNPPAECQQGPTLLTATSITNTQTQAKFDGLNVQVIEWFIRTTSDVIEHTGTIQPGGSTFTINHPPLTPGTHNLQIRGSSCTSQAGVVDNLDFVVGGGGALDLTNVNVSQREDGRYGLQVIFSGGIGNYTVNVRGLSNNVIATFPNTTGSPANIILPSGTLPQSVKVSVMDVNNAVDEISPVVLPAPTPQVNFLQANNFFSVPTKTPMENGSTYFIGEDPNFNFDIEFVYPNGGQWDYIKKRLRKLVSGTFQERSISVATGQPQNYAVASNISTERAFLPRTGQGLVIDGQNVFKTGSTWEITFEAYKNGTNGAKVAEATRVFTITAPPTLSGIILYNRNGNTLGSPIGEINSVGSSYAKPTPHYDLGITDFGGVQFNQVIAYFRQKVNDVFIQRRTASKNWSTLQTSVNPNEWTLLEGANLGNQHVSILAAEAQTWQIEFVAMVGSKPVASKSAIFDFTVNVAQTFSNQGFARKVVAGRSYQVNPGLDFGARVLPDGKMQLYHPANRPSLNGQNTVYPWIYYNHVRMDSTDLAAFRSNSGLAFPTGKHTFSIKWHSAAVANYDDVIDGGAAGNSYNLAGENIAVSYGYSGMDDYFTFTIVNNNNLA